MKQLYIIALLLGSLGAAAQTDTAKKTHPKPVYQPNLQLPAQVDIRFSLPGNVINDYIIFRENGRDVIFTSNQISAGRATEIENNYKRVSDSLRVHITDGWKKYTDGQQAKFTADTTAQFHPKKGGKQ